MSQGMIILASVFSGVAVFFLFLGIRYWPRRDEGTYVRDVIAAYGGSIRARDLELRDPFVDRVIRPTVQRVIRRAARFAPSSNVIRMQERLLRAGEPFGLTPLDFAGLRILSASLGAAVVAFVTVNLRMAIVQVLLFTAAGLLAGYILPNIWLNRRIRSRQRAIRKALPDVLDMLTICVNAGLGFDAAMARVVEKWHNPLTEEFERVLYEMRMGLSRAEALRNLAERTAVPELSSFVAIIVQAERLGASISHTLQSQAEAMREHRRLWAEEQARKAPIKMLIPLVLFIFPSLFVIILGPAVPRIMASFGK